jgi:formate hydrogenlyase subunit 4
MTPTSAAGLLILLAFAPAVPGIAGRTRSALTGRRGAPMFQLYADLAKLWRKGAVYSHTTTALFRLAPLALAATTIVAAALLPLDGASSPLRFTGDLVAFAGLFALGRFLLTLAAMDTGSSFEGLGASREVTIAAFAEPALVLCFTVLAIAVRDLHLQEMLGGALTRAWPGDAPSLVLVGGGLFVLSLAESGRVPVDDPLTHLELTMIHEVMVLDHSGPDLALVHYAGALKMTVFGALVVRVFAAGPGGPPAVALGALVAGLVLYAMVVGTVEAAMARFRMDRVPQLLVAASAAASFGLILLLR